MFVCQQLSEFSVIRFWASIICAYHCLWIGWLGFPCASWLAWDATDTRFEKGGGLNPWGSRMRKIVHLAVAGCYLSITKCSGDWIANFVDKLLIVTLYYDAPLLAELMRRFGVLRLCPNSSVASLYQQIGLLKYLHHCSLRAGLKPIFNLLPLIDEQLKGGHFFGATVEFFRALRHVTRPFFALCYLVWSNSVANARKLTPWRPVPR